MLEIHGGATEKALDQDLVRNRSLSGQNLPSLNLCASRAHSTMKAP